MAPARSGVLGRETFAAEISWQGGWPRLGRSIENISTTTTVERLDDSSMARSWVSPARFPADVLRRHDGGWLLRATTDDPAADDLSFVGRRQEHLYAAATAIVRVTEAVGGLSVRIDGRHHLDLEVADGVLQAVAQTGEIR